MSDVSKNSLVGSGTAPTAEFLKKYVFLAVQSGEVGNTSPYSFSISTGNSGLAFGSMQHDTLKSNKNERAQTYFRKILDAEVASGYLSQTRADAIYSAALNNPKSLERTPDADAVNAALMRHSSLVDQADEERLDEVVAQVELVLKAAEKNPNGPGELNRQNPDLEFIAELAMWSNRGSGLKETSKYIEKMPKITRIDWENDYLSQQEQFTRKKAAKAGKNKKKESFPGWLKKVKRAAKYAEKGTSALREPEPTAEQAGTMLPYGGPNGSSGVVAYLIEGDSITLRFVDRPTLYVYDANRPGLAAVHEMQRLARHGAGLTTYINQHVRKNYALKIG